MTIPPAFNVTHLGADPDVMAPDGSGIRILPRLAGGSMAHGTLAPHSTSLAIRHRTVEEIWFVLEGHAEMWRQIDGEETIDLIGPGDALTIPLGTAFQFRTVGNQPFQFVLCTMPPWPNAEEAIHVPGIWETGAENA